jgi:hypothetical protein
MCNEYIRTGSGSGFYYASQKPKPKRVWRSRVTRLALQLSHPVLRPTLFAQNWYWRPFLAPKVFVCQFSLKSMVTLICTTLDALRDCRQLSAVSRRNWAYNLKGYLHEQLKTLSHDQIRTNPMICGYLVSCDVARQGFRLSLAQFYSQKWTWPSWQVCRRGLNFSVTKMQEENKIAPTGSSHTEIQIRPTSLSASSRGIKAKELGYCLCK